ncbi:MAG: YtxH domain-containing protein [Gemmatimonadota bacterium]|nr:YtxH domain-containing protein [Gemmatimonadota bacterium]
MSRYEDYDDDQVVVVERDGGMGVGAFALGLAIGAAAALLWAPASGEETRARLKREARRASERARALGGDVAQQFTERAERVRDVVDERIRSTREVVSRKANDVSDAVSAGKDAAQQARIELNDAVTETKRAYAESRAAARAERGLDVKDSDGAVTDG